MKIYGKRGALGLLALVLLAACSAGGQENPAEPEVTTLIYAKVSTDGVDWDAVSRFNKTHDDVQIEVRNYSLLSENGKHGMDLLMSEIAAGRVPDIIELGRSEKTNESQHYAKYREQKLSEYYPQENCLLPYRQMAKNGYLEDLWPYIENDPDIGREKVVEAPLKAAEVNGGLYMLFEKFVIFTLIGRESVVGARYSWTMEDMMEAYAAMPEGSTILRYNMTKRDVFYNLLCNSLEQFVDRETGKCCFDGESFRSLVVFLETIPDEAGYEDERETEEEIMRRIKNGTQMLEGMMLFWPQSTARSDSIFRERAAFAGYPTADGSSGSFFYLTGTVPLGMSADCRNKEAAWEYIRQMITPRLRKTNSSIVNSSRAHHTPINLNDYEALCWYELDLMAYFIKKHPDDPAGSYVSSRHFRYGPEIHLLEPISEEHLQRHRELIDHTTQLYWPEDELSDIVWETLGAYFAGDRTLDDTIGLLNNRVGVYLNEQK